MGERKKYLIRGILGVILFLSGGFITVDWLRLIEWKGTVEYFDYPVSSPMKIPVTILCFILVFMIEGGYDDKKDAKRLMLTFTAVLAADLTMFFGQTIPGILLFALCQMLLIYRNGDGMRAFVRSGGLKACKKKLSIYAAVVFFIGAGGLCFVFYPLLRGKTFFYLILAYSILLCVSLWVAWTSREIKRLPRGNTILISIGMTFFVLCDFTVGFDLAVRTLDATKHTVFMWMISSSLTWMFYAPALVLLAISGYDLKKLKSAL